MSTKKLIASVFAAALLVTAGCGHSDDAAQSTGKDSVTSKPTGGASSGSGSSAPTSGTASEESADAGATDASRSPLPDGASDPYGTGMDDQSVVWSYGRILLYTNSYPGTVQLSADAPEYDAAAGGYTVMTSFEVYSGYDIILASEWTLTIDGQQYKASPSPDAAEEPYLWLPDRTPIGNNPEAVANGISGKLYFPIPQTNSPITMSYDNVSGDVHFKWAANGKK